MTVEELLNGVIYAGTLAGAIAAIMGVLHFGLVRPLRNFLRSEIVEGLTEIKQALQANAATVGELRQRLDDHISHGGHLSH